MTHNMLVKKNKMENVKTKKGRKKSVRNSIIRAAERGFAKLGFHGASTAAIAEDAGIQQPLVHYYFKTKDDLYRAVFENRVSTLNTERFDYLDRVQVPDGDTSQNLEEAVRALVGPVVGVLLKSPKGGRHYAQLLCQLISNPEKRAEDILNEFYDPVALRFISHFEELFPGVSRKEIVWAYMFALGAMVQALSHNRRVERLSDGECDSSEVETIVDLLVPFISGGFDALAARSNALQGTTA